MAHFREAKCNSSLIEASQASLELQALEFFRLELDQLKAFSIDTNNLNLKTMNKSYPNKSKGPRGHILSSRSKTDLHDINRYNRSLRMSKCPISPKKVDDKSPISKVKSNERNISKRESLIEVQNYESCHHQSSINSNSLPSISSSPSLSPSLICKHLALENLLNMDNNLRNEPNYSTSGMLRSPHTVGLCSKCRLSPPPNIHSPLSPMFRPSNATEHRSSESVHVLKPITKNKTKIRKINNLPVTGSKNIRDDDSLDFFVDPELRQLMSLSPIERHSVEFIRSHSSDSARVIKLYKNGQPYDRPLRISVGRDEFHSLDHLLDHINYRLLVSQGARYLFHLDGQLVYSINELKHRHSYIVSGQRHLDQHSVQTVRSREFRETSTDRNTNIISLPPLTNIKQQNRKPSTKIEIDSKTTSTIELDSSDKLASQNLTTQQADGYESKRNEQSHNDIDLSSLAFINVDPYADTGYSNIKSAIKVHDQGIKTSSIQLDTCNIPQKQLFTRKVAHLNGNKKVESSANDHILKTKIENSHSTKTNQRTSLRKNIVRAKSDPRHIHTNTSRAKKNVTFMDTGRGSSPAINGLGLDHLESSPVEACHKTDEIESKNKSNSVEEDTLLGEFRDIGIQVSDSIEGFLIDLPIALPKVNNRKTNTFTGIDNERKYKYLKRGQGVKNRLQIKASNSSNAVKRSRSGGRIVTITERQLSNDEMKSIKDLDQGNHHRDKSKLNSEIPIKLVIEQNSTEASESRKASLEEDLELIHDNSIVPCPDEVDLNDKKDVPGEIFTDSRIIKDNRVKEMVNIDKPVNDQNISQSDNDKYENSDTSQILSWGRASSVTPTERPVSQSAANDAIRARVTTPTPSPSIGTNGADNTSLSVSYDTAYHWVHQQAYNQIDGLDTQVELPEKFKVPVKASLCKGSNEPNSSFVLMWVNGFAMNEGYDIASIKSPVSDQEVNSNDEDQKLETSLEKSKGLMSNGSIQSSVSEAFEPNERYANWMCHSRIHDELIYPVGRLVVLWCRWTDEQRFYSKHSHTISALTLGPEETDLAVSGQLAEPKEQVYSCIHVWSVTKLDLLINLQANSFLPESKIFSINFSQVKPNSDQMSLEVGSTHDKRVWITSYNISLTQAQDSSYAASLNSELKTFKPVQAKQIPLCVARQLLNLPTRRGSTSSLSKSDEPGKTRRDAEQTIILALGRRMFQPWLLDRNSKTGLKALQCDEKSSHFVKTIFNATYWLSWSTNQLIVADSNGNLNLIEMGLCEPIPTTGSNIATTSRIYSQNNKLKTTVSRYRINRSVSLFSVNTSVTDTNSSHSNIQITCMARVSKSLLILADTNRLITLWRLDFSDQDNPNCMQVQLEEDLKFPDDFGFVCSIVLARYSRRQSQVEFYVASSTNSILFASISFKNGEYNKQEQKQDNRKSAIAIVYDGHETPVVSLVSDQVYSNQTNDRNAKYEGSDMSPYYTCSLDCKICKWNGKDLLWKSVLPSACVSMALHPIGLVLAVGSGDGTVYILDKMSGLLISYFPLTPVCINSLAYSRDGALLAAGCANGSIFILPSLDKGYRYHKVSIFQSPYPILSIQFSWDAKYILTSVTHKLYQELILWDLPNFRYMRNEVTQAVDKIKWYDPICSGSEDVRAIWENANLAHGEKLPASSNNKIGKMNIRRQSIASSNHKNLTQSIVNLSCHRLIRRTASTDQFVEQAKSDENLVVASDMGGFIRLFRYPCYDIEQGFYQLRLGFKPVNCCRFLNLHEAAGVPNPGAMFVSTSLDGSIGLWRVTSLDDQSIKSP